MSWAAYFETASGRLLSVGSDDAPAPTGVTRAVLPSRPADDQMWDAPTRSFVARPPKVLVDRLDDLRDDPELLAVWASLTPAQRLLLRNRIGALLGRRRWRAAGDQVNLR